MKIRDAIGVSIIIHGILILTAIFSVDLTPGRKSLSIASGESYYIDYITLSGGSESASATTENPVRDSVKSLTTPNNKSGQSKLKYFDKKKKKKKRNTVARNQKKKKIDRSIATFKRKDSASSNRTGLNSQTQGVRIGISSGGAGTGIGSGNGNADPIFSGYFFRLRNKISRYWHKIPSPNKIEKTVTTIKFKIFRNGKIDDIQIEKSSGNSFNDRAALRAIRSASPFERLPYQYNLNYLLIHFEFIWE